MAIFLFDNEVAARKYADRHPEGVGSRVLQKVRTVGEYTCSFQNMSWIDYLRIPHFLRPERIEAICRDYWIGRRVIDYTLTSFGKLWTVEPLVETVYGGSVEFYDGSFLSSAP